MEDQGLKEIIQLVERFRSGVSLNQLLSEEPKWDKKVLQRKLRELTSKNKVIRLGKGRAVLYIVGDKNKFPKPRFTKKKDSAPHKHIMFPLTTECKWSFLSRYITTGASSSIKKCAKAIFSHHPKASQRHSFRLEGDSNRFSDVRRIAKEKSDMESHKILNHKIDFTVLNI